MRYITLILGTTPKQCAVVRRVKDADGAACRDCDTVFTVQTSPYWPWRKSQWLHETGSGHRMDMFCLPREA